MADGFVGTPSKGIAGREDLSDADIKGFVQHIFGESAPSFLQDAVRRADGRFRKRMFEAARAGAGVDQRLLLENNPVLLAIVNGAADPIVNLDYLDSISFPNLWEKRCHRLPGLHHAPFWEAPEAFAPLLNRFLRDTATLTTGVATASPTTPPH
jgi:pimeloyl-ACP methyl ester carboxylesterase